MVTTWWKTWNRRFVRAAEVRPPLLFHFLFLLVLIFTEKADSEEEVEEDWLRTNERLSTTRAPPIQNA
jgi:hypothetical protein